MIKGFSGFLEPGQRELTIPNATDYLTAGYLEIFI